ncbi:hypothetical protein KUTeg_004095 [Tegillarca granosa]|uniref:Uncharacterized protein n=1 Tax=Tegillarca granosa TaxID=220873 RepID=A0ABQ9FNZ7_TEGGR|nr:hypothetical protein KUTeg_004095 [Tegillarca granosa]
MTADKQIRMPAASDNRPTTYRSGVSSQPKYSVQHRSDILLTEQTENVKNAQNAFTKILADLENAKTEQEIDRLRAEAETTKEKADQALMILYILNKIDGELVYARADLQEALDTDSDNINAARKRVMWLEDRMGTLCGKIRLRGQATQRPHRTRASTTDRNPTITFRSTITDDDMSDDDTRHRLPLHRARPGSDALSLSGSEDYRDMQQHRRGMMDTPSSAGSPYYPQQQRELADSESESENMSPTHVVQKQQIATSDEGSEADDQVTELPTMFQKDKTQFSNISTSTPEPLEPPEPPKEEEKDEENEDLSKADEEAGESEDKEDSSEDKETNEDDAERSESGTSNEKDGEEEKEEADKVEEMNKLQLPGAGENKTFMTELSAATNKSKSRVTIVSPKREDTRQAFLREIAEEERDIVMEYWQSEHHRFEFGEFSDVLCQLDPLSYHQMGLAVPGSFLQRYDKDFELLPWNQPPGKRGGDIMDIHRKALDKLALKIHRMYDKVYSASLVAVRPAEQDQRESSFFRSIDFGSTKDGTMTPNTMMVKTLPSLPSTSDEKIKPNKGKLIYYPKPIPPPEVLPLTRTTKGKEYPRLANSFGDPDPSVRKPALRIADQRNLANETKLSLYKEKNKGRQNGPSTTERNFRRMFIEKEASVGSVNGDTDQEIEEDISNANDVSSEVSGWSKIKPKNKGREYSGLKWERVKHLGLLRCGDAMVFYALKERMKNDEDQRVRYEAAKSLILIGCWEEDIQRVIIKYLVIGNAEIRQDIIRTMIDGKNVQHVNKNLSTFPELVKVLSHFCRSPDPDDSNALDAAVLLGKLCVADDSAKIKLKRSLHQSDDTHSLEILVKQLNCTDYDIVMSIMDLLNKSPVWKYRELAANLLIDLGQKVVCSGPDTEKIYEILEKRLWDESQKEVRLAAAKALAALGMFGKACEKIEKRLDDAEDDIRAQAVISVGTLGMKTEKISRVLLEMLELDSSDYIVRTFVELKSTHPRIIRALKERERADGQLGREAKKAVQALELLIQPTPAASRRSPIKMMSVSRTNNHKLIQSI